MYHTLTGRRHTLIFLNLLITCIASSFLSTAMNTALPPIIEVLRINLATGQWLTSGYSLAMGIMMPLTAFLITRFPTRCLYITAIALFLAGLAVCIFAPNFPIMMVGRIMQACSNGITTSMAQVVLLSIYPPEKRGTIMGWYGLSVSAAPIIAPTLAGILVDTLGWKMIFVLPFGILALSLIWAIVVFDNVLETQIQSFDVSSFILSILAFGGLTLGIGNVSGLGLSAPAAYIPLAVGVAGSVLFVWRQLTLDRPFLELRTLRSRQYAVSVVGSMLLYLTMMGGSQLIPLYVQTVLGRTATVSGLVTFPGSLATTFISPIAGRLYDKMGMRKLALIGSSALVLSCAGMVFVTLETPLLVATTLNVIRCGAIGCLMMPFVTWGITGMTSGHTAHGTALLTSLRTISGAVGTAVFAGIMNTVTLSSAAEYGERAGIHGMNVAFLAMGISAMALLVLAVAFTGTKAVPNEGT